MSKNASVGTYYLYSYGVEPNVTKHTHFLALRANLSGTQLSDQYYIRVVPQAYYLRTDGRDGFYFNSAMAVGRRKFPVSISAMVNKTIQTRIAEDAAFMWNVSVSYSIN